MENNQLIIPNTCILETTRLCNFSCFMCPHKTIPASLQGNMTLNDFKVIVDKTCKYIKVYQLYWLGEPFLNPQIWDMITYLKGKTDAKIIVSTNGSLLKESMYDKLVSAGIDKLIIDIDSGKSEEIYSAIRKGGDFNKLISNVEKLINKNQNNSMEIVLQFLQFKINSEELKYFKERWEERKCTLRVDWIDTWASQMPELVEVAAETSPYAGEARKPCADLWHRMTINFLGNINLCCHDFKGLYEFGNAVMEDPLDIWNGEELNTLRKNHLLGKYMGLCKNCTEWAKECEYEEFMS